jgi:SAM-dependent methyltransferase
MDTLRRVPASGPEGLDDMNQLLAESVPLAHHWAPESCWRDPANGESCAWYHGLWQVLRLVGVVTTLTHHADLYIKALQPLIASGRFNRVLISGSADYGLLSIVIEAFQQAQAVPEITVVDRCETPLRLCRWYAERFGYRIETAAGDLTAFRAGRTYDLVCAHSLLSRVPVEHHAQIAASWAGLLRPGGILLMANNLYPGVQSAKIDFAPDEIPGYQDRVAKAAAGCAHRAVLPSAEELDRMTEAYAVHMSANVIGSRDHLTAILEAHGFDLLEARFGDLIKDPNHRTSGAQVSGKKEYAWIVARRT